MQGYIVGGLLLALVTFGGLYKCERDGRMQAETDKAVAVGVNQANEKAQAELKEFQGKLNTAVEQFAADRKEIDGLRRELRNGIQQVLKSNVEARQWAGTGIHPDFVRMFNEAKRTDPIPDPGKEAKR